MVELPTELWLYITEFIPDHELENMLDVSRVFLLKRLRQVDWLCIPCVNNVRILVGTRRLRAESCA